MKYRYVIAIALAAIAATACSKNSDKSPAFATVNGEVITQKEFEAYVTMVTQGGSVDRLNPDQKKQVADQLIKLHAAAIEAEKAGLDKSADTINKLNLVKANILTQALVQQYNEKLVVSDAEAQEELDARLKEMPPPQTEYKVAHILVKTKEEADSLISQLNKGGDFAELATKHSTDTGSAKTGGEMDWTAPTAWVPEFGEAVKHLEKGQITKTPVKSQYGYHVIKLIDSRSQPSPKLTDEGIRARVDNLVKQKKAEKYLEDLRSKAKVEYKTESSSSSSSSTTSSVSSSSSK